MSWDPPSTASVQARRIVSLQGELDQLRAQLQQARQDREQLRTELARQQAVDAGLASPAPAAPSSSDGQLRLHLDETLEALRDAQRQRDHYRMERDRWRRLAYAHKGSISRMKAAREAKRVTKPKKIGRPRSDTPERMLELLASGPLPAVMIAVKLQLSIVTIRHHLQLLGDRIATSPDPRDARRKIYGLAEQQEPA